MKLERFQSGPKWLDAVRPLFESDPVRFGLPWGIARRDEEGSLYYRVVNGHGETIAVAFCTPGHKFRTEHCEQGAVELLAHAAHQDVPELPGVSGVVPQARLIVERVARLRGQRVEPGVVMVLYRLTTLIDPSNAPGAARRATESDAPFLRKCAAGFAEEVHLDETPEQILESLMRTVRSEPGSEGAVYLWEVDGEPVSSATHRRQSADSARISFVFTPKDQRGNGYAAHATAAAVRGAQAHGASVITLFAESHNATSNRVYQRLGFEEVIRQQEFSLRRA